MSDERKALLFNQKKTKKKQNKTHTLAKLLSMIRKNWNFWDKSLQAVKLKIFNFFFHNILNDTKFFKFF